MTKQNVFKIIGMASIGLGAIFVYLGGGDLSQANEVVGFTFLGIALVVNLLGRKNG